MRLLSLPRQVKESLPDSQREKGSGVNRIDAPGLLTTPLVEEIR